MSSIFIQISSYHDYEIANTINSAIKNSSGNNKINFGIHLIYNENNDIEIPNYKNIKTITSKAPKNLGMGRGRLLAHKFYSGEDYYVQIDAHTIFDYGWDEFFISDIKKYQSLGFNKPLLTTYPRNYWYNQKNQIEVDNTDIKHITFISFHENKKVFLDDRVTSQTAILNSNNNIFSKSVSGGSIFTVGEFIKPNPKIFANGEEIFIAARAWTNGYDLLLPSRHIIYHLYYNHNNIKNNKRRLVWNDYPEQQNILDIISRNEIRKTLSEGIIGEFRLGSERSIEDFGTYAGLDFKNGIVLDTCQFHT